MFVYQIDHPATGSIIHNDGYGHDTNSGLVLGHVDQNGQDTIFEYDSMFRLTTVFHPVYPVGGTDSYTYNVSPTNPSFTFTKSITSSTNFTETGFVDGFGRPKQTQTVTPACTVHVDTTYDADGRKFSVSNPYCTTSDSTYGVTKSFYDALNRVTSVVEPDNSTIISTYSGNCTTTMDEEGKVRKSCADGLGRLTSVIEDPAGLNYLTTYTYDALNNLTSVTQNGSRQRTFVYDSLSRLTQATTPESGTVNYTYDANGNVVTKTDARSITATYTYDALERPTSETFSNGNPAPYSWTYDACSFCAPFVSTNSIGRLVHASNDVNADRSYSYDPMGRVTYQTSCTPSACAVTANPVSASYDLAGDLTSLTYPSGRVVNTQYNEAMQPTQVTFASFNGASVGYNYLSNASYAPNGARTSVTLGSGVVETECYNNRLQPGNMQIKNGAFTWLNRTYNFYPSGSGGCSPGSGGNNGNVMGIADNLQSNRTQTFGYDNLNRIFTAQSAATSGADCWGQSFGYDAWANLLAENVTKCSGTQLSVGVSTQNRITNTGVSYDAAGNMLTDGINTYTYDAENQLATVSAGDTYTYDAEGNRVRKDVNGSTPTEYTYFNGKTIAEKNVSTGVWSDYIFAGSRRLASAIGSNQSFITNGSFESGLTGWSTSGSGTATVVTNASNAHSGGNYIQLTANTGNQPEVQSQSISVQPGEILTFGGWVNLQQGTGDCLGWSLKVYNSSNQIITYVTCNAPTSSGWTYQVSTYTVPSGAAYVALYAQIYLPTSTTVLWADDGFLNTGTAYYHADQLGSARVMSDTGGNVIWSATYLPFGQEWNPQPTLNHYKFNGHEHDAESGLNYFGARYDSPQYGRFMTPDWSDDPDPIPYGNIADPQSLNLYPYVRNNPLNRNDPDGHCYPVCTMAIGAGIGAVTGALAEMGAEYAHHQPMNRRKITNAAVAGAVTGAIIGLAPESAGVALQMGLTVAGNVIGGGTERSLNGETVLDAKAALVDAAAGAISGRIAIAAGRTFFSPIIRKVTPTVIDSIIDAGRRASDSGSGTGSSSNSSASNPISISPNFTFQGAQSNWQASGTGGSFGSGPNDPFQQPPPQQACVSTYDSLTESYLMTCD